LEVLGCDLQRILASFRHNEEDLRALGHSAELFWLVENHAREDFILTGYNANPDQFRAAIRPVGAAVMNDDLEVVGKVGMKATSQLGMFIQR
jgi:hypothetical protein